MAHDRDVEDIASVASFFNTSKRMAAATDTKPKSVSHHMARTAPESK